MHNFSITITFIFSILLFASTLHAVDLNWENDYDEALEQAQKEKN